MPSNFRPILSNSLCCSHFSVPPPKTRKVFLWKVVDILPVIFLDEPAIGVDTAKINESEKKNVQMHIQDHDHDHGVGWCAKIVFFTLMAILAGLVVLIVLENRGGSDRKLIILSENLGRKFFLDLKISTALIGSNYFHCLQFCLFLSERKIRSN